MKNRPNCKHNPGVVCMDQTKCGKCGWNPKIAEQRIRQWRKQRAKNKWNYIIMV